MLTSHFCFEFHSFSPLSIAKTVHEALSTCTLQLFGRTSNGQSVCLGVIGVCPYFYLQIDDNSTDVSVSILGGDGRLNASGLNSNQFSLSVVNKTAFYQFQTRPSTFVKVECCNEGVRKRLLDFVKVNADLNLKIFEVIKSHARVLKTIHALLLGTHFFYASIHVRFRHCRDGQCYFGQLFTGQQRSEYEPLRLGTRNTLHK